MFISPDQSPLILYYTPHSLLGKLTLFIPLAIHTSVTQEYICGFICRIYHPLLTRISYHVALSDFKTNVKVVVIFTSLDKRKTATKAGK